MNKGTVLRRICSVTAGIVLAAGAGVPATANEEAKWGETLPALRIRMDAQRSRIWVLNLEGVHVYDSVTRKLVKHIDLPDWVVLPEDYGCAPDMVLTASGAALVTSNVLPVIWEIDAGSLAVRQNKLALETDNDREVGFSGLAFVRGGKDLVAVSSPAGSAWRLDLAARKARKLRQSAPVRGLCGAGISPRAK